MRHASQGKHPRLRGEHPPDSTHFFPAQETPPLTRGTPLEVRGVEVAVGNTPAYAGNTAGAAAAQPHTEKHPRLRGEHAGNGATDVNYEETPPLTRGTRSQSSGYLSPGRNTPAYAGNTLPQRARQNTWGKHPRLRGEHTKNKISYQSNS